MNPKLLTLFTALVGMIAYANGQIGAATIGLTGLSTGTLALTSGTLSAFLTPAGAVAVGIGIIGAAIVKKAIAANVAGLYTQDFRNYGQPAAEYGAPAASYGAPAPEYGAPSSGYGAPSSGYGAPKLRARGRRDTAEDTAAALDQVDAYFYTVANVDFDDCGKRLVCEVEALPAELRNEDEVLIASLFGENNVIDPASPKAEYDLAAYLGASTRSKVACVRRYHKCPMDRKTIIQGIQKQRAAAAKATE